uniref:Uncharacterized protein n=1 Tax=Tanacetum cinerariifolium TaxID=118510 RepID=A0A699IFJ2_TANCI|nr:hypothetical protein [Tanacetum cinerariifolium]
MDNWPLGPANPSPPPRVSRPPLGIPNPSLDLNHCHQPNLCLLTLTTTKSAHAEEPSHTVDDSGVQQDQEFDTGSNDEQPADKDVSKEDCFKKPEQPLTPDSNWNKRQHGPKRQHFYGFAANMSSSKDVYYRKRIIAVTRLTIMKKYDYGHLEEIEVHREDQMLYKFREDAPVMKATSEAAKPCHRDSLEFYTEKQGTMVVTTVLGINCTRHFHCQVKCSHWQYKFPLPVKVVATARRLEMPLLEVCTAIEEKKKKLPVKDRWQLH